MTRRSPREILSENLRTLLELKNKRQADVINDLGIAEATFRSWYNGTKYPRVDSQQMLADYFNVPRSRLTEDQATKLQRVATLVRIPILGTITCGEPILAEENLDGFREEIGEHLPTGDLFYLRAKGDSMAPTIPDDSFVLIRKQESVENGEIAAVLINGDEEATLKRVKRHGDNVILMPDNNEYEPIFITEDFPARIIGKAIKYSVDL